MCCRNIEHHKNSGALFVSETFLTSASGRCETLPWGFMDKLFASRCVLGQLGWLNLDPWLWMLQVAVFCHWRVAFSLATSCFLNWWWHLEDSKRRGRDLTFLPHVSWPLFTFCLSLLGLVDEARQAGRWPLIESDMETDCNSQSTPGTSALKLYQKMAQFKFWPNFNWGLGHHLYYLRIFSPFLHCTNVYFVYCRCIF